jgi:hypothetical protein
MRNSRAHVELAPAPDVLRASTPALSILAVLAIR